jgi:hypothetical protein
MTTLPRYDKNDRCSIFVYSAGVINGIPGLIWKQYVNKDTNETRYSLVDSSETWEWRHVLEDWRPVGTSQIEIGYSPASRWTSEVMSKVKAPTMGGTTEPTKVAGTPDELKINDLKVRLQEAEERFDRMMDISEKLLSIVEKGPLFIKLP